jgi:hypothetical protein
MESVSKMTKDQSRDTGMAMVLLCLLLSVYLKQQQLVFAAIALHVVNMTLPQVYRPVAVVWLGLAHVLGMMMSKVLLSLVFFAIVTPVGVLRRLAGKDSLKLRAFKASEESVMLTRNHTFASIDIERPY